MANTYENLLLETDEQGIATLTINRPKALNALNSDVLSELATAFDALNADDSVHAVIVTGSGEKAFVAGADIKELANLDPESGERLSARGQQVFDRIEQSDKPVIAVINGYALGGGAELAMACHIRIAEPNAVLGLPEVGLGLIPGYGGTQRFAQLAGKARAYEFVLTGGQINAQKALAVGLVNEVAEEGGLAAAKKLAQKILKNGPLAVRNAIRAIRSAGTDGGFEREAALFGELCGTDDFKEGTTAFIEKRKPEFKGR
ncbi:MAG: enoyl-CoA hydratase-related protein [Balneolaceae bacterium]